MSYSLPKSQQQYALTVLHNPLQKICLHLLFSQMVLADNKASIERVATVSLRRNETPIYIYVYIYSQQQVPCRGKILGDIDISTIT